MKTPATCIVCSSKKTEETYATLKRCQSCGFVFADPNLTEEEYTSLYGEGYFSGEEYGDYRAERPALERNFRQFLKRMAPHVAASTAKKPKLLEIGCAYGFFLNLAQYAGFAHVEGIDINGPGPRYAREELGLEATSGDFLSHDFTTTFDVFCLWDAVEHIKDLSEFIGKIRDISNPGALLFLTTNDISSLNARLRKGKWRQIHPPTHLWYFSPQTMGQLLDRYGFDVLETRSQGYYRSVGNVAHHLLGDRVSGVVEATGLGRLLFPLNLGDIFWLAARLR